MDKEDKIIKVETEQREMSLLLKDGTKVPTKGKVVTTFYESGRKDSKVIIEKPFSMSGEVKR